MRDVTHAKHDDGNGRSTGNQPTGEPASQANFNAARDAIREIGIHKCRREQRQGNDGPEEVVYDVARRQGWGDEVIDADFNSPEAAQNQANKNSSICISRVLALIGSQRRRHNEQNEEGGAR